MAGPLDLARVDIRVSGVVGASLESAWAVVRQFGSLPFMRFAGHETIAASLLPGSLDNQVGAVRCVSVGSHKLVERLTGLDDTCHCMSYKLISHHLNSNPFTGSFVNYAVTTRLLSITLGNLAFCEMEGSFYTEHDQAQGMHSRLEGLYVLFIESLSAYVNAPPPRPIGVSNPVIGQRQPQSLQVSGGGLHPYSQPKQAAHGKGLPAAMSKHSGDSGHSQGETVSALHAPLSHSTAHPRMQGVLRHSPGAVSSAGFDLYKHQAVHLQQEQQQQQRPLAQAQQQLYGSEAAQEHLANPFERLSLQQAAEDESHFYPRASVAPPHTLSTPFAAATGPAPEPVNPATEGLRSFSSMPPVLRQSSADPSGPRPGPLPVSDLLSSGAGGRTHVFGGESKGAHTAIRDLHSSGASTIGPGTLQPLGSADSLGIPPGIIRGIQGEDSDAGGNTSTPTSIWFSQRTDSGH